MRRPGCRLNYLRYFPNRTAVAAYGLCSLAQAKRIKTREKDKHNLTVISSHWALEEASCPVNLSVFPVGVPPTAPVRSVLYNRYSKTDPEVPAHLNLYGSPIADNSTLCTQWREGLSLAEAFPTCPLSLHTEWRKGL